MIPFLKRFYTLAPNGKMELFGVDGCEHAFISGMVMSIAPSAGLIIYGWMIALITVVVTWVIMRLVWWSVEYYQEKDMLEKYPDRVKVKWTKWRIDRMVDMKYPLITDTVMLIGWLLVLYFVYYK